MAFSNWLTSLLLFTGLMNAVTPNPAAPGRIEHLTDFPSRFVQPRNVDVWLPEGYPQPDTRYAVLYMQDGQNLFDPKTASYGVAWEMDSTLAVLGQRGINLLEGRALGVGGKSWTVGAAEGHRGRGEL